MLRGTEREPPGRPAAHSRCGVGARSQPAAAPDPAADARAGLVLRRGGPARWIASFTVYTLAMTRNLARPPRPATLDGHAKGLDAPVSAVRAAAAESTGLHYYDEVPAEREHPGDRERELLIASIDELTPEDRRHVAALVESLRSRATPTSSPTVSPAPGRWISTAPGRGLAPGGRGRTRAEGPWPGCSLRPASAERHRYSAGPTADIPSCLASCSYGPSGSTRHATRRISLGSSPGG